MSRVEFDALHRLGIAGAFQALYTEDNDFRLDFQDEIRKQIFSNIPPALQALVNPQVMTIMVDFSMLLMFQPESDYKDKIYRITADSLLKYIREVDDPERPVLRNFQKLQPYVLRDIPRKFVDRMPVPNWEESKVWDEFKTVPANKQGEVKRIIAEEVRQGGDQDRIRERIMEETGISEADAQRIAVNEVRRARHWAYNKLAEQLGYRLKKFHAAPLACPKCKAMDEQTFDVSTEVIPDLTHPNCRCATFIIASSKVTDSAPPEPPKH